MPNQQPNSNQQNIQNKFWQTNLSIDRFIKILGIICLIVLSLTLFIAISSVLSLAGELVIFFGSLLCFPLLILISVYVFLVLLRFKNLKKPDRFLFVVNLVITALVIGIFMIGGYGDIFFGIPVLFLNTFFPIEIELPNSEINLPDETASWQTYRNQEYGFEVKYPKDWAYKEEENYVSFDSPERVAPEFKGEYFYVGIEQTKFTDIQDWFNNEFKDRKPMMVPEKSFIDVGGVNCLVISDPITFAGESYVNCIKNSRIYEIDYNQKFLPTFKFISR